MRRALLSPPACLTALAVLFVVGLWLIPPDLSGGTHGHVWLFVKLGLER